MEDPVFLELDPYWELKVRISNSLCWFDFDWSILNLSFWVPQLYGSAILNCWSTHLSLVGDRIALNVNLPYCISSNSDQGLYLQASGFYPPMLFSPACIWGSAFIFSCQPHPRPFSETQLLIDYQFSFEEIQYSLYIACSSVLYKLPILCWSGLQKKVLYIIHIC